MQSTGAYLPAGRVFRAADARVVQIRRWREEEREKEVRRLMPARRWRPWRIGEERARKLVERRQHAAHWWSDAEHAAWNVMNLARAMKPHQDIFVSAKDFRSFSEMYEATR